MTQIQIEETWQQLYPALRRFVVQRIPDESTALDVLQTAFLKILSYKDQLREEKKVNAWVYQIIRNVIIDHYRAENKTKQLGLEMTKQEEEMDIENRHEEFAQCIPGMLDSLPEKYKTALVLTELKGLSQKELAEQLGITYSGAKSRVQRGRKMLKEAILACCEVKVDTYGNVVDYNKRKVL